MTDPVLQHVIKCTMTCKTSDLQETMKFLSVAIPRNKKGRFYNCEMTVKTDEVDFVVIGASRAIYGCATGPAKVSLPFWYFNDLIQRITQPHINMDITEGFLTIGKLTVEAETCFFQDDSILKSIKLPMNFSLSDLLRINEQYTPEEIAFHKIDLLINKIDKKLCHDIDKISIILKSYGIARKEIQKFVFEKINDKPQMPTKND